MIGAAGRRWCKSSSGTLQVPLMTFHHAVCFTPVHASGSGLQSSSPFIAHIRRGMGSRTVLLRTYQSFRPAPPPGAISFPCPSLSGSGSRINDLDRISCIAPLLRPCRLSIGLKNSHRPRLRGRRCASGFNMTTPVFRSTLAGITLARFVPRTVTQILL